MRVLMTAAERALFESFARSSQRYLEFGAGGSTCVAAQTLKKWIISIDSSDEWLENVSQETALAATKPKAVFVDIGPLREFGAPADWSTRPRWPDYHEKIWQCADASKADLCFVDGRFRVACAMQCLVHCRPNTPILVHDYYSRVNYHVIENFAREIARAEDLSVFLRLDEFDRQMAADVLEKYRFNPE